MKTSSLVSLRSALLVGAVAVSTLAQASTDYGPAAWVPPCNANYNTTGYGHKFHVVHDIEGYYASTISYFAGCGFNAASIHYVVNGKKDAASDANAGAITQMVRDANYAWHALCWNAHSTGTEHEGFVSNPAWYTTEMYQASAGITANLANKFGWAKDRNHVISHGQKSVAGWPAYASASLGIDPNCNDHTDPGPHWNWSYYMSLVGGGTPAGATTHDYLGALGSDGTLLAKDGAYGGWTTQLGGVSAFQIEGGRIALLQNGALLAKDGGLYGSWTTQSPSGVSKFQLCGNRIGALYGNGILSCKDGLYGSWYDQLSGVSAFYLDGDRIGVLAGGVVYTKWGLLGGWTAQTGPGVVKFQIKGERLGVLYSDGLFTCKDTENGTWYNQLGGVTDFRLDGNRIACIAGGVVYVKDGLQGAWTTQTGAGFVQVEIRGERIGALGSDGTLLCKDGVYGSWYTQVSGVSRFQLDGDRIGLITTQGKVTLKYGLQGGWLDQTGNGFLGFQLATWVEGTTAGNPATPPAAAPGAGGTEVIVDNADAGFSVTGSWATASSATDKYGADYRYHSTAAVSEPATWTGNLTAAGNYQVFARWAQGGNRSASAPYVITHTGGSTTVNVSQQAGGGAWQSLGSYSLNAGNNTVQLSCWTTTGYIVVADAVRWLPQ